MSHGNRLVKQLGLSLGGLLGLLGLIMILPTTALASGSTVWVAPPNGVNDTANIQAALNACVAQGPGCTVQLREGKYLTRQLVTYNFQGTFKGMGQNRTTIQALPNLAVTGGDPVTVGVCKPNTTDCLWPSLIIFVDGNISVSDFTVYVPSVPATQTWYIAGSPQTYLNDGIRFMGQNRTNASVQRVTVEGMPDTSVTSCPDFNFCNAVIFAGEFPKAVTPFDYYFLSGKFSLSNSYFKNVQTGVIADAFLKDSIITIGGSPSAGNVFENVDYGPVLTTSQNSIEEVSFNTSTANYYPVLIVPWNESLFVPSKSSTYLIHDNALKTTGPYANAIFMLDDPTNLTIHALIYNNSIEAQDIDLDAIFAEFTTGTTIVHNTFSGTGPDAIGIYNGTSAAVLENDVTNFTANPGAGLAQIVLDGSLLGLTDTSDSTVVCRTSNDTVLNLGTDNRIIGCQLIATPEAATRSARPNLPIKKPHLP
jgi:hypothetical protein